MKEKDIVKFLLAIIIIGILGYFILFIFRFNSKEKIYPDKYDKTGTELLNEIVETDINEEFNITEGISVTYQILNKENNISLEDLEKIETIIKKRLEAVNIFDYYLKVDNDLNRIYIEIPNDIGNEIEDLVKTVEGLNKTAKISFTDVEGNIKLSGDDIKNAKYSNTVIDATGIPKPHVVLEFSEEGRKKFKIATAELVGEVMPITLDGEVITSPYVDEAIDSNTAIITMGGDKTYEEKEVLAREYAMLIDSGTLPFDLEVVEIVNIP